MNMKLIPLVITLVVGIILAGSVLMPVINDVTAKSDTFVNEGYFYVDSVENQDSMTYKFEDGALTINDEVVALPTGSEYPDGLTIFYTEHICVRYDDGYFKVRGVANHNCYYMDVTVEEGTITGTYQWTDTPATVNWTYTEFVGMVGESTNRVMGKSMPHFMNSDSYLETTGLSNFGTIGYAVVHIAGSIEDGVTVNLYNQGSGAALTNLTVSNIQIDKTDVTDYVDLYKINKITFDVTDGANTATATYTIYTIPASVTADRANPMPDGQAAILTAIPVLIITALVVMAAGALYLKRDD